MKLLRQYLLKNYSQTFFPIFITLYTITSIVYLVKIASLTSIIQITSLELIELYLYSVPSILFYTLPVSIFVSMALSLAKLSSEYELIVITSFGFNPLRVIRLLLPSLIGSTILLLIISLGAIPKADNLKHRFVDNKKTEAQFNIKPSEYGQSFGDWLIYVQNKTKNTYSDIVLYKNEKGTDTFIKAQKATLENKNFMLIMTLENGQVVKVNKTVSQVDFKKMIINNTIKQSKKINTLDDLIEYWKTNKKVHKFIFAILSSIFPFISILFILFIGYYNPRYQANRSSLLSIGLSVVFLVGSQKLSHYGVDMLWLLPLVWIALSIVVYIYKIKRYY